MLIQLLQDTTPMQTDDHVTIDDVVAAIQAGFDDRGITDLDGMEASADLCLIEGVARIAADRGWKPSAAVALRLDDDEWVVGFGFGGVSQAHAMTT